ncbi:hypothetical protein Hanom_Chr01g00040721 [Helianthus anomalus]
MEFFLSKAYALLYLDPFDAEAQKKIEGVIWQVCDYMFSLSIESYTYTHIFIHIYHLGTLVFTTLLYFVVKYC